MGISTGETTGESPINSKQLFAAIVCSAASAFFVHTLIQSGGGSATISLRAVDATTTPIKACQLQYWGPVVGHVNSSESREIRLPRIPEGNYHFLIQSPGFQERQWRQRVTQKMNDTTLLVRLNVAKPSAPFRPVRFQTPVDSPVRILSDIAQKRLTRVRIRCYRMNAAINLADRGQLDLLRSVAEASPIRETLPSPKWTLVWEDYLTVTGGIRTVTDGSSLRSFRIPGLSKHHELSSTFSHSGIYTLEMTAASDRGLFDPIQYPILVSPYLVFRDKNRHIHWIDAHTKILEQGTLYAATIGGDGLQIRRIANLKQYNHSPGSVPGARFLILSNGASGITLLPNSELTAKNADGELWIYGDNAQSPSQSVVMVLTSDITHHLPQFGKSESLGVTGPDRDRRINKLQVTHGVGTTEIDRIPRSEMIVIKRQDTSRRLFIRLPASNTGWEGQFSAPYTGNAAVLTGPVAGVTDQPNYAIGDSVKLTVSADILQPVFVEFPEALGGGEIWIKRGAAQKILTRVVVSNPSRGAFVKMTTIENRQLKTQLIPIPLRRDGLVPTAEFVIDTDELRPGGIAHLKIRNAPSNLGVSGRHYVIASVATKSVSFSPPPIGDWVRQVVLKRSSIAVRWPLPLLGAAQAWFDGNDPADVEFQIPNITGELVVLLISQIEGVGIQQKVYRIPIRRPIEVQVSLPLNAHPNDVIKWAPSVRNNEKKSVTGVLKTYWNDMVISSQSIVIRARGAWSEGGLISMPATGEPLTGVVKTVFTPVSGNPVIVKSFLKIVPIRLPKIIRNYDILGIDSDTPSTDISNWLLSSREPIWITSQPGIIRLLLLQSIPIAPLSDVGLAAYEKIEADQLLASIHNDVWGKTVAHELKTVSAAMGSILTAGVKIDESLPPSDRLSIEALVAFSLVNSPGASPPAGGELGYSLGAFPQCPPFNTGFALGVLYRTHAAETPEFFESVARRFKSQFDDDLFIRGFQLAASPGVIGQAKPQVSIPTGNAFTLWLRKPIDDPVALLERGAMISMLFDTKTFRYQLVEDQKIIHERRVNLIGVVTLPETVSHPQLMATTGQRFIVFRKSIDPVDIISTSGKWESTPSGISLLIPLPANITSNSTIAIPLTTGVSIKTIQIDNNEVLYSSDAEWVYVTLPSHAHYVRITYAILYKGFRPASVAWIQTHKDRHYIRIPKVEL